MFLKGAIIRRLTELLADLDSLKAFRLCHTLGDFSARVCPVVVFDLYVPPLSSVVIASRVRCNVLV